MASCVPLLIVASLAIVPAVVQGQFGPAWTGGGGSQQGGASLDDLASIVDYLEKFTKLPPAAQQAVLVTAGVALQTRTGMDCNIFGGPLACRAVPADSSYIKQCAAQAQPKVDCLFREAVEANVYDSPVDNLEAYLKQKLKSIPGRSASDVPGLCPQCFDQLQSLWCSLAVPSCGTFDVLVRQGILPALAQAIKAYRTSSSATRADAASKAVAAVLQVAGAGLPCAEMCEAVLDTCAVQCGGGAPKQGATLGQLIQWMVRKPEIRQIGRMPDLKNARQMFQDVWDQPLCSLFPRQTGGEQDQPAPGSCTLPPSPLQCASRQRWCDAMAAAGPDDNPSMYIQSLILVQLLRAATGWITDDDTIIWDVHSSVNEAVQTSTDTSAPAAGSSGSAAGMGVGQVVGIVFLCLVGFALVSAGVAMAALHWWRSRADKKVYYHELSDQDGDSDLTPLNNPHNRL